MTHVHEDIGAYVLGALDEDGTRRVAAHLKDCTDCAAAHAELAGLPALLDMAVATGASDEEPLPPAIEERILDRFAREREPEPPKRRRWRRRLALAVPSALAGAAVAAAALTVGFGFKQETPRPPSQYRLVMKPIGPAHNASARAGLRTTEEGTVVRLWVNNLPGGPQDVYEVFCDAKGWSASAGTFRVDAKGNGYVILTSAVKRGQYESLRIVRRAHFPSGQIEDYDILGAKLN
ncbi:zf-HC2 domain-containing protein [Solirubrobacter phytolaccae]|uniref:Zf-HC2 domain-containing protein n=1 Tax=Solirubrobacter phytolaccae TaxID=1404360 RepID=A0A9X3NGV3_9ACTN|nr:zf-HC2 domain-containing protein [Solirubrobacter phytolaccae]MDA0184867.1 zf-HC2 domain-containing protein [Solirubrobacter phytolaccae]